MGELPRFIAPARGGTPPPDHRHPGPPAPGKGVPFAPSKPIPRAPVGSRSCYPLVARMLLRFVSGWAWCASVRVNVYKFLGASRRKLLVTVCANPLAALLPSFPCPRCQARAWMRWGFNRSGSVRVGCGACRRYSFTPGRAPVRVSPEQWAIVERAAAAGCTLRQVAMVSGVSARWLWERRPELRRV